MPKKPTTPTQTETQASQAAIISEDEMKEVLKSGQALPFHPNTQTISIPTFRSGSSLETPETVDKPTAPLTSGEKKHFAKLRRVIRTGVDEMYLQSQEVGAAMLEVKEKHLYRGQYKNFTDFCEAEFKIAKSRAYELAAAAEVRRDFSAVAENGKVPENERQIRPLTVLKGAQQRLEAWDKALLLAGEKPVTEAHVRKAVGEIRAAEAKHKQGEVGLEPPTQNWKGAVRNRLKEQGYDNAFEQPLQWNADAVDLLHPTTGRFVKLVVTLTLEEAASGMALRKAKPDSLVIVNAEANSPDGLLYSQSDDLIESFTPAFNVMASSLGAILEDEGTYYQAGPMSAKAEVEWKHLSAEDCAEMGIEEAKDTKVESVQREMVTAH